MKPIIEENNGSILTMSDEDLRVDFVTIGEGWNGDYNADDPEDEELIRFDVYVKNPNWSDDGWQDVDSGSYCTCLPVNTPIDVLKKKIKKVYQTYKAVIPNYDAYMNGASVKHIGEELSYLTA